MQEESETCCVAIRFFKVSIDALILLKSISLGFISLTKSAAISLTLAFCKNTLGHAVGFKKKIVHVRGITAAVVGCANA